MEPVEAILDFVKVNRKPLASFIRNKLLDAGAKEYVGKLGKDGIAAMEREAAGVLLDLACKMVNRLQPDQNLSSEEVLHQLPQAETSEIRLPRSDEYYRVLASLDKDKRSEKE